MKLGNVSQQKEMQTNCSHTSQESDSKIHYQFLTSKKLRNINCKYKRTIWRFAVPCFGQGRICSQISFNLQKTEELSSYFFIVKHREKLW